MACPDELTLDLWLADALEPEAAAAVAAHARTCAACTAAHAAATQAHTTLRTALALDPGEHAYLRELDLSAAWRAEASQTSTQPGVPWGWLALIGIIAAFGAWAIASPMASSLWATAAQIGVSTILMRAAIGVFFGLAQGLWLVISSPALSYSPAVLGLIGIAILAWPKRTSGPVPIQTLV